MRKTINWIILLLSVLVCVGIVTASSKTQYPGRPILLVCPWAAGGGTDRVSRTVAAHLERDLGVPVNVINATGGKGVTGHSRGLRTRPDGYTLLMATLELNMMHWSGLTKLTYHDCDPLMSVNEDYAAIIVREDAPWRTVSELEAAIRDNPQSLKCSGTAAGGAWHLALAGWLVNAGMNAEDVVWVSSTGAGPSLQELLSGGLDLVCCSLPEADTLLDNQQLRALALMAPKLAADYPDVPTFREQGTDWSLGGWRAIVLPLGVDDSIRQILVQSLERVVTGQTEVGGQTFPEFMKQAKFDNTYRSGDELRSFLAETDQKFGKLLTSDAMRSVNRDPFDSLAFPRMILAILGIIAVSLAITSLLPPKAGKHVTEGDDTDDSASSVQPTIPEATADGDAVRRGLLAFVAFPLVILAYIFLSEVIGFVLFGMLSLLLLMIALGAKWQNAVPLAAIIPPVVYLLFVNVLRVPLPRGWLG